MKLSKILLITLGSLSGIQTAFAETDNTLFQNLDNQIGIGYSYISDHAYNSQNSEANVTTNSNNLNLHLEQLFNNNVWLTVDGSFAFKANQSTNGTGSGFSYNTQEFGFPANISAKAGYSFNSSETGLQAIPYLTLGRALNYNGMSISQNKFNNSYLNQYGIGGRIEYAFNHKASIYFDQSIAYWQDPNNGEFNQSGMNFTSLLGIKYNVTDYFQLGVQGMFSQFNLSNENEIGYSPVYYTYQNTSQTSFGGMINFAYLYDHDQLISRISAVTTPTVPEPSSLLASFDNSYSLGMGWVNSTNNYKGSSATPIDSSMNYINFNVAHLFDNQVWANINAQLVNSISQTNVPAGRINSSVPTYIGFPGNVAFDIGYGFQPLEQLQIIPYANTSVIMNMNSYNLRTNSSIMNAISQDMYLQYGLGGRVEYAINNFWQIYADQLVAQMDDQSSLGINAWHSTSSLGVKINPGSVLQIGLKGFYDYINPEGNAFSVNNNSFVPAQQSSLGMQLDIGLRY